MLTELNKLERLRLLNTARGDIQALEKLLSSNPKEEEVHRFLNRRRWLLGPVVGGMDAIVSKPRLGSEYVPDFVAYLDHTGGTSYVFVELEPPDLPLMTKTGNPSSRLTHAIGQTQKWRAWIQENLGYGRKSFHALFSGRVSFVVVAGRRSELDKAGERAMVRLQEGLKDTLLMTYDRLLEYASKVVENIDGAYFGNDDGILNAPIIFRSLGGLQDHNELLMCSLRDLWHDLLSTDEYRKTNAIRSIGEFVAHAEFLVKESLRLVQDKSEGVRTEMVHLLRKLEQFNPDYYIIQLLNDENDRVRAEAITALGGNPQFLTPINVLKIVQLAQDPSSLVRASVASCLCKIAELDDANVVVIDKLLNDDDVFVSRTSIDAVLNRPSLPSKLQSTILGIIEARTSEEWSYLVLRSKSLSIAPAYTAAALCVAASGASSHEREIVIRALGSSRDLAVLAHKELIGYLSDENEAVRRGAIAALVTVGSEAVHDICTFLESSESVEGKTSAIDVLRQIDVNTPEIVSSLQFCCKSPNKAIATMAQDVMAHLMRRTPNSGVGADC